MPVLGALGDQMSSVEGGMMVREQLPRQSSGRAQHSWARLALQTPFSLGVRVTHATLHKALDSPFVITEAIGSQVNRKLDLSGAPARGGQEVTFHTQSRSLGDNGRVKWLSGSHPG